MNIAIDESGSFTVSEQTSNAPTIDVIAAVLCTNETLEKWNKHYLNLPKANSLDDSEASAIINFLYFNGFKICIVATDTSAYSRQDVIDHRKDYIKSMHDSTSNDPYYQQYSVSIYGNKYLSSLSTNEYLKAMLFNKLVENIIRTLLINPASYYSLPRWISDKLTPKVYRIVQHLIHLQLNRSSQQNPFNSPKKELISEWLNQELTHLDATKILRNFSFEDDNYHTIIKAADCIANFIRGLLRGNRQLPLSSIEQLNQMLSSPYAFEALHFNKDKPEIDCILPPSGAYMIKEFLNQ